MTTSPERNATEAVAMEEPRDETKKSPVGPPEVKVAEETETQPIQPTNGHLSLPEDDNNNEELTPPPDTPAEETVSHASSVPVNALEDEIVVGTNAQIGKPSPIRAMSEQDNDVDYIDDQPPISHYPKRKRASVYNDLSEDKIETSMILDEPEVIHRAPKPSKLHGISSVKGVMLGYWRDSDVPDEHDKHGVVGFIDVRDRLRTRIQPTNRFGKIVADSYPIPPGPGGSWVTFDKVCFDPHLVNLDHFQVKEYVKIRMETIRRDETEEETKHLNREAVKEAIRRVQENPPPETSLAPAIAYGPEIPEHAQIPQRHEAKKRRIGTGAGTIAAGSPSIPPNTAALDPLNGTRPTKILLGHWVGSSEPNEGDKHAVFGILGANDMFRVKLTRETRDGRHVDGNFPSGAGALWIHWDEVKFEPHIESLTRPEIKEYVRIRQRQLDEGERPDDRVNNETQAVAQAQMRVAAMMGRKSGDDQLKQHILPVAPKERLANGSGPDDGYEPRREYSGHELRTSRRDLQIPRARHSLPDVELRAANRTQGADALERTNHIARREIARVEAAQARAEQRAAASRDATSSINNKAAFQENIHRLNKVWSHQEAKRLQAGVEDAKIHNGVKYERKQNGPFQGKLVSQGTIISIDGEDYVEYRVLTKPSFF